jgi:hypothetical protein
MPIHFDIVREQNLYSVRADGGPKIAVGQQVHYRNKKTGVETLGLANDNSPLARQSNYVASNFSQAFGFWAAFIEPTAFCEGQSFITLNTYDRARFTFGFAQFAAHVPDGDFVLWFRDMLGQPETGNYFPDLAVQNGRIVKLATGGPIALETASTTEPLMNYLNPSLNSIEDDEVIAAGKFIHWTINHPNSQALQVSHMITNARALLVQADTRIHIDGVAGDLCCLVMDILHQGRGAFPDMLKALHADDPFKALLAIGAIPYPDRVTTLGNALKTRRDALAQKKWSRQKTDFV